MNKKVRDRKDELSGDSISDTAFGSVSDEETSDSEKEGQDKNADSQSVKELDELRDKYLRLAAEFDNFRKRTSKEILEIRQTASKDVIVSLLEVLDDIDRAELQIEENEEKSEFIKGVVLIFNKFRRILEQRGLRQIETFHTDFDVEKDEAVSEAPVEDEKLKGKVVAEVQKGYTLNGKLIRFAKVVVGR